MLDELYSFGYKPGEAEKLSVSEMTRIIKANRKKELDNIKIMARVAYNGGLVASSSMSTKRPRFEELFNFPKDEMDSSQIEQHKAQMVVWAQNVNRLARRSRNERRHTVNGEDKA